jgi:hypothetical protein
MLESFWKGSGCLGPPDAMYIFNKIDIIATFNESWPLVYTALVPEYTAYCAAFQGI